MCKQALVRGMGGRNGLGRIEKLVDMLLHRAFPCCEISQTFFAMLTCPQRLITAYIMTLQLRISKPAVILHPSALLLDRVDFWVVNE